MKRGLKPRPAIERLLAKIKFDHATGCWVSQYKPTNQGYTMVGTSPGRFVLAHRLAYEFYRGPIPAGLDLDHLCRVRRCCNPLHLEPVTRRENMVRGESPTMRAHLSNTCKRGHSLLDAYSTKRGGRICRTCQFERNRRRSRSG